MNKIKAFFKNILVRNLIIIGILSLILIYVTECSLRTSTRLGESMLVPDFTGLTEIDVQRLCEQRGLNYQIKDTAFVKNMPKKAIIDQQPMAESSVKKGRTIYLTINSDKPPMVTLQDLTNSVERQAMKILENDGFIVDPDSEYEPDPALGWVLKVKVDDEEVEWGTKLPKGTRITLVLGNGSSEGEIYAPNLFSKEYKLTLSLLHMQGRVLGDIDSTELNGSLEGAMIYRQHPYAGQQIKPSDPINIWICDSSTFNDIYRHNPPQQIENTDSTTTNN